MSTRTIVILIIVVLLIVIALISKHHKHKYVFHEKQVADAIGKVFSEAGTDEMAESKFLHDLQLKVNCSAPARNCFFSMARRVRLK